jgi:hypothetical protein
MYRYHGRYAIIDWTTIVAGMKYSPATTLPAATIPLIDPLNILGRHDCRAELEVQSGPDGAIQAELYHHFVPRKPRKEFMKIDADAAMILQ